MVDRMKRDVAAGVLRKFLDGAITNDEFERCFPTQDEDPGLSAIKTNIWTLYSDLYEHRLSGNHSPPADTRVFIERCILFLKSDLEFQWPVPRIRLSNLKNVIVEKARRLLGESVRVGADGAPNDEDVWPFFTKQDYESFQRRPDAG